MNISLEIAGLLGPVLIVLPVSEYVNFTIWRNVDPTVVALNGLVLFAGGLAIVRYHPFWRADWTVIVTLLGWLILLLGAYRMFFPTKKQLQQKPSTNLLLLALFLVGCFLTSKAYFAI